MFLRICGAMDGFKRISMKIYLILISIIIASCNAIKPETEVIKLDGTKWALTAIKHKPVSNNQNAYLEFDSKLNVKGKVFCNSVSGGYELMGKDQLTFDKLASTKMYCEGVMDQENEMITNMENVKRYQIKNQMLFLYNSDEVLLTFKRE